MLLNRIGNKRKLVKDIIPLFMGHNEYIEPFFGTGSTFFAKPPCKHNVMNDNDSNVYNLFKVLSNSDTSELFHSIVNIFPLNEDVFNDCKNNVFSFTENEEVNKAYAFVILSNFSLYGKMTNINTESTTALGLLKRRTKRTIDFINRMNVLFLNRDADIFLKTLKKPRGRKRFIYHDPPYLGKTSNYYDKSWTQEKLAEIIDLSNEQECYYAISEYSGKIPMEVFLEKGLNVFDVKEKRNITSDKKAIEVIATNYSLNRLFQ